MKRPLKINKRTGAVDINLPRKQMPLDLRKNLKRIKNIDIKISNWELI